jgi:hypothetical protein
MTKSLSDDMPEIKRQWSVLPVRALLDRDLAPVQFRTLAALCIYTNSHGVCWPGIETLSKVVGSDKAVISRTITRLVKLGYVRRLRPQDYQMQHAKFGQINRYQVLYKPDAPLPTWEEVKSAMVLAPVSDAPVNQQNDKGSGDDTALVSLSHSLAHAYLRAVTRATGQTRSFDNEVRHARKLAATGATIEAVTAATEATCREWLAKRAGIPALSDVAATMHHKQGDVCTGAGV